MTVFGKQKGYFFLDEVPYVNWRPLGKGAAGEDSRAWARHESQPPSGINYRVRARLTPLQRRMLAQVERMQRWALSVEPRVTSRDSFLVKESPKYDWSGTSEYGNDPGTRMRTGYLGGAYTCSCGSTEWVRGTPQRCWDCRKREEA